MSWQLQGEGPLDLDRLSQFRVLVLNSSYEPIKIVNWKRAILLLLADKIEVLDCHPEAFVHSVCESYSLPSVVRILSFVRVRRRPKAHYSFSRHHIFMRDEYCCQYCAKTFSPKDLTLDHVMPVTRGGLKTWDNLVSCCVSCNQKKGSRTPEEAHMSLLKVPSKPRHPLIPELLNLRKRLPESWRPYIQHLESLIAS
jgi:5-methylcytosine-specific restriction endonuclease McrA